MNNDAFRALVNKQRAAEKSTKEIAREAVEDEFQKKRSRGGGGGRRGARGYDDGYGSDSGGSSDEDDRGRNSGKDNAKQQEDQDDAAPDWKRRRREKKLKDGSEYRDRAKERREGSNLDYAALQGLTQSGDVDRKRQAELSKYLGGDEEHTHLVKGLDRTLAEKVRREEMGQADEFGASKASGDLDQLLEDVYAKKQGKSTPKAVQDWQTTKPKTELGKSVLSYLLQKKKFESATPATSASATQVAANSSKINSNPIMQKSIKRSVLTFSLESDARQLKNAWEVPGISVRAFGDQDNDASCRKTTPLNHHMIATISKKLDEGMSREKEKSKYHIHANGEGTNGTTSNKLTHIEGADNNDNRETNSNKDVKVDTKASDKLMDKDDSDDDIFENVGSYLPQALAPNQSEASATSADSATNIGGKDITTTGDNDNDQPAPTQDTHKQAKKSIFENLIPETAPTNPTQNTHSLQQQQKSRLHQHQRNSSSQKRNVIDRDVLGGEQNSSEYSKRRGPTSAAIEGFSLTSYQGGYGEEMDVDFGGNDDDRRKRRDDKGKEDSGGEADGKDSGDDED